MSESLFAATIPPIANPANATPIAALPPPPSDFLDNVFVTFSVASCVVLLFIGFALFVVIVFCLSFLGSFLLTLYFLGLSVITEDFCLSFLGALLLTLYLLDLVTLSTFSIITFTNLLNNVFSYSLYIL